MPGVALVVAVLVSSFAAWSANAAPQLWGSLRPGPYAVGFRAVAGESAPGSAGWKPRTIEIAVWYPAEQVESPPLAFGDYFSLSADLRRRSAPAGIDPDDLPETLAAAITGSTDGITREQAERILASPMFARRDARPGGGRFPVVLWTSRYGTAAAQSVLSEMLASRGFVVAAVRPSEAVERLPFELKTAVEKSEELEAQSDDLRGALRVVRAMPFAMDRTAVIAWSYAGEAGWALAQADARIELLIDLDSNSRSNWVYRSTEALEASRRAMSGPAVFELRKGQGELTDLAHGNFNTLEGMIPGILGIEHVQPWSRGGGVARQGYEKIASRVAEALEGIFSRPPVTSPRRVELRAKDDASVIAELYPAAKPDGRCALLLHQSGSSRGEYRTIGPELVRLGWTALAVDLRWGDRDRWNDVVNETAAPFGTAEAMQAGDRVRLASIREKVEHDLDAAIAWLRRNGCPGPLLGWGASIQANGVLELAARRPEDILAVVAVSPGEYSRDDPQKMRRLVQGVRTPALVLWGRDEKDVSSPVFEAIPPGAKWSYVSGGRHGNAIFFEDPMAWPALHEFLARISPRRAPAIETTRGR